MKNLKIYELKDLIADGKTHAAIEFLLSYVKENHINNDDIYLLSSRFNRNREQYSKGLIDISYYNGELVKINYVILNILDDITHKNKENTNITERIKEKAALVLKQHPRIAFGTEEMKSSIEFHIKKIDSWSKSVGFKDASKIKSLHRVFVDLDYYLTPRRLHIEENLPKKTINLNNLFDYAQNHIVILGQPGAGKTTTMQKVVQDILHEKKIKHLFKYDFPFFVRLRDLNNIIMPKSNKSPVILLTHLLSNLGIRVVYSDKKDKTNKLLNVIISQLAISLIDDLNIFLIFDGFDEVREDIKRVIINEIKEMCLGLTHSRIVLTSRTGDYHHSIENTSEFEICPLENSQIVSFINQWLENPEDSKRFYNQLIHSPFHDTAIRPLNLAHLCAIYERYQTIPEKPKTVYKKIINLLLEEWDLQRDIIRKSKYSKFEIDRKFDFLSNFAYSLTYNFQKSVFNQNEMNLIYKEICGNFALPPSESKDVVNELESHTGIFLQSGYDRYEFSHKSLQEFLTAEYIVKLPATPYDIGMSKMPAELAVAVAISSNSSMYFAQLVFSYFRVNKFSPSFLKSFINRIVIEKADFYENELLGASILYLFTLCYFFSDKLSDILVFDDLTKIKQVSNSINKLIQEGYYKIESRASVTTEEYDNLRQLYPADNIFKYFNQELLSDGKLLLLRKKTPFKTDKNVQTPVYVYAKEGWLADGLF